MKAARVALVTLLSLASSASASVLRYDFGTTSLFVANNSGGLGTCWGVTFGPDGNLYVGDVPADAIRRYDGNSGAYINDFIPSGGGGLDRPRGIAFGPDGTFWVSSVNTNEVLHYSGTGTFLGASSNAALVFPYGLTIGPDGNVYVCSHLTHTVVRFDGSTGAFMGIFASGGPMNRPTDLTFQPGPTGDLLVSSAWSHTVLRYNRTTGTYVGPFVAAGSGGLNTPQGLAYRGGVLYVASSVTSEIKRYDGVTGAFLGNVPGSGIQYPNDLTAPPDGPAPADALTASGIFITSVSEPDPLNQGSPDVPLASPWSLLPLAAVTAASACVRLRRARTPTS
jgi:sugar lactone lactonase YvrE